MNLFLDDIREVSQVTWVTLPQGEWVVVRSHQEFVDWITKNGLPKFISFDHDLGVEHYADQGADGAIDYSKFKEKTGMDCAKWLIEYCMDRSVQLPDYAVHSMNGVGSKNILMLLIGFAKFQHRNRK